jgi:hypothetical protein
MIIECNVTEIKEPRVNVMVRVPPSDELFFLAHKVVLAMRLAGVWRRAVLRANAGGGRATASLLRTCNMFALFQIGTQCAFNYVFYISYRYQKSCLNEVFI